MSDGRSLLERHYPHLCPYCADLFSEEERLLLSDPRKIIIDRSTTPPTLRIPFRGKNVEVKEIDAIMRECPLARAWEEADRAKNAYEDAVLALGERGPWQ